MRKTFSKKAALAAAIAVVAIAITAGAAFAAPVLKPGVTSWPGMSGTCTNCHTYAAPAAPATPAPSHPYVSKAKIRRGRAFNTWGYVSPSVTASEAAVTMSVQRKVGKRWVAVPSASVVGTCSAMGKFAGKTNYTAKLKIGRVGTYRIRTKLVYLDADAASHTKWSSFLNIKVKK